MADLETIDTTILDEKTKTYTDILEHAPHLLIDSVQGTGMNVEDVMLQEIREEAFSTFVSKVVHCSAAFALSLNSTEDMMASPMSYQECSTVGRLISVRPLEFGSALSRAGYGSGNRALGLVFKNTFDYDDLLADESLGVAATAPYTAYMIGAENYFRKLPVIDTRL